MHRLASLLLILMLLTAGCMGDAPEEDSPVDEPGDDDSVGEEDESETPVLTGGDPEDDTHHSDTLEVASATPWDLTDHRFRLQLKLYQNVGVEDEVRLTVDVGTALSDAGLAWIRPGVDIGEFEADPRSVVLYGVSSSGRIQKEIPVEARQAETHSLEIAFEHVGGQYVLYFGDMEDGAKGLMHTEFPDAEDAEAHRSAPEWNGNDFWGVTAQSGKVRFWPGETIISYATIHTDGRQANHGGISLPFNISARVPSDWEDVETDPEESGEAQNQRRVSVTGTSPEDASGSDTLFVDVESGGQTVTVSILIKYHEPQT